MFVATRETGKVCAAIVPELLCTEGERMRCQVVDIQAVTQTADDQRLQPHPRHRALTPCGLLPTPVQPGGEVKKRFVTRQR